MTALKNDDLQKAVGNLQILDISLISINADIPEENDPTSNDEIPKDNVRIQSMTPRTFGVRVYEEEEAGLPRKIQFRVKAAVRILETQLDVLHGLTEEEIKALRIAEIKTNFMATYLEKPGAGLSKEAIEEFGIKNVPFNVWPYWREIVHAVAGRMGLPRIVLPLYALPGAAKKTEPVKAAAKKTLKKVKK